MKIKRDATKIICFAMIGYEERAAQKNGLALVHSRD
jgi:hypothetical protein